MDVKTKPVRSLKVAGVDVRALVYAHGFTLCLILFAIVLVLFGGSSRYDRLVQIPVRLSAIAVLIWVSFRPPQDDQKALRAPALLLAAAIALVVLQLIPMPPALWTVLPGRGDFASLAPIAGFDQPWRPIAVVPDMAVNALLSLTVPLAVLWGLAVAGRQVRNLLYPVILAIAAIALIVETLQLITGAQLIRAVYETGFEAQAAGIFANRNHQALLLAITIPLLAGWQEIRRGGHRGSLARLGSGTALVLLIIVLIATGSRAGLALGVVGIVAAIAIFWSWWGRHARPLDRRRGLLGAIALVAVFSIAGAAVFFGRSEAIDRLLSADPSSDLRLRAAPVLLSLSREFLPVGSGFGSFDSVFRRAEPTAFLDTLYFNQAHNDLLQVVLEGGVPGLILLVAAVIWTVTSGVRLWMRPTSHPVVVQGRAANTALLLMIAASAVDYPLRTPTMMALAAAFAFLVAAALDHLRSTSS